MSHKSQAFPMVCNRILYTEPLPDSIWCQALRLSLSRMILSSKYLFFYRTFNLQYIFWKSVCNIFSGNLSAISFLEICLSDTQTRMLENRLKLSNDKTEALLMRSSSKSFSVSNPPPSLPVAVKSLFLLQPEILVPTSQTLSLIHI